MAEETNPGVPLREFIEALFKAQATLMNTRFDAADAKVAAHAELDAEKWESHKDVHRRERGIAATLLAALTTAGTYIGSKFPR